MKHSPSKREAAATPWPVDVLRFMAAQESAHREATRPAGALTEAEAAVRLLDAAIRVDRSFDTVDAQLARTALYDAARKFARMSSYWRDEDHRARRRRA